jgi:hypothetical protein
MNDLLGYKDNIDPDIMINSRTNWDELSPSPHSSFDASMPVESKEIKYSNLLKNDKKSKPHGRKRKQSEVTHMEDLRESVKQRWKEKKEERTKREIKYEKWITA